MCKIAVALACLVCTSCGMRVQSSSARLQSHALAVNRKLSKSAQGIGRSHQNTERNRSSRRDMAKSAFNIIRLSRICLLAHNPATAFYLSCAGPCPLVLDSCACCRQRDSSCSHRVPEKSMSGDWKPSADWMREQLTKRMKQLDSIDNLGSAHPDTIASMERLASQFFDYGDLRSAQELQQKVLQARIHSLGHEHPDTLGSKSDLATISFHCGDLKGTKKLQCEIFQARMHTLGFEHADTIRSKKTLESNLFHHEDLQHTEDWLDATTHHVETGHLEAQPFGNVFALPVMDGVCVAVHLPGEGVSGSSLPFDDLHQRELEVLHGMRPHRQKQFAGGRIAMRRALQAAGEMEFADEPVLSDKSGAPTVPSGIVGSISHTNGVAAAFICPLDALEGECVAHNSVSGFDLGSPESVSCARCAVGIDMEIASRKIPLKIAKRVLAEEERQTLGMLTGFSAEADLLLRASIKEALYKAFYPLVRQTIYWHSVQVQPKSDGTCTVHLTELEKQVGSTIDTNVRWRLHDGYFLSFATATLKPWAPSNDLSSKEQPDETGIS